MGQIVMVMGESGTGKTASLRNFKKGEVFVFETAGKPLPFKNDWGGYIVNRYNYQQIERTLLKASQNKDNKCKTYVIDDSQYLMAFQAFAKAKERGYDKFTDMACDFKNLLDFCQMQLPDDYIVYLLHHSTTDDTGFQRAKTIGKMLDSQLVVEGMFTTVLLTEVEQGHYSFITHNIDGLSTVKTPIGMFKEDKIDNDLAYVDRTIREYYDIQTPKKEEKK